MAFLRQIVFCYSQVRILGNPKDAHLLFYLHDDRNCRRRNNTAAAINFNYSRIGSEICNIFKVNSIYGLFDVIAAR